MSSIDALTAAIRTALDRTRRSLARFAASLDVAEELRGQFEQLGVEDKAAQAAMIADGVEGERARIGAVADRLAALLAAVEALRGDGEALSAGGGGALPGQPPVPAASAPEPRPFKPMRTDPEKADEIRPYVGEPNAYATLYDEHGRQLVGVHNAGDEGPASDADWHEPWESFARLRRHVEPHAAARMHRDGHRQLAMYINMAPCSYPDGCKRNLRALIPVGTTLFVHQVFADGGSKVHPFPGTGKALRSSDDDTS